MERSKFAESYQTAANTIIEKAEEFRLDFRNLLGRLDIVVDLEVHWVPGHQPSLIFHEQADRLAVRARKDNQPVLHINGYRHP